MYTKIDAWSACSIAMNDHACILIWDAHTRMGHNIVLYVYWISHMHMGRPIHVWANIRIWGRTAAPFLAASGLFLFDIIFNLVYICIHGLV